MDFGNYQPASIHGQKFHDHNADGRKDRFLDSALNGWTIQVLDAAGSVVATQVTDDEDLDGDGSIDP